MCAAKMHADEVETDAELVRRLLREQFPQWTELSIERIVHPGTDNAIYRLGDELAVRMPRIRAASGQVEKEARWLPKLAPHLPLAITMPLATGSPGEGYPWRWAVCTWLPGKNATARRISDMREAAVDLARFIAALHGIDATGAPAPGRHNFFRGVPLAARDEYTRDAIVRSEGLLDTVAVTEAWELALDVPAWTAAPVWIHGDLSSGNMLAQEGRLSAIIDWGGLGAGDPAVDLIIAWSLFSGESRAAFRAALAVDDATWARGRGWALSTAIVALPYYIDTNPSIVAAARHIIAEVLAEHRAGA